MLLITITNLCQLLWIVYIKLLNRLLKRIRKFLPNFGAIDLSPVLLIILIEGLQFVMTKYGL